MLTSVFVTLLLSLCVMAGEVAWENTPVTTDLWNIISSGNFEQLMALYNANPNAIHSRSADGRGPLFWAYEFFQPEIAAFLLGRGTDKSVRDSGGSMPSDLLVGRRDEFEQRMTTAQARFNQEPNLYTAPKKAPSAGATSAVSKDEDDDDDDDDDDEADDNTNLKNKIEL